MQSNAYDIQAILHNLFDKSDTPNLHHIVASRYKLNKNMIYQRSIRETQQLKSYSYESNNKLLYCIYS